MQFSNRNNTTQAFTCTRINQSSKKQTRTEAEIREQCTSALALLVSNAVTGGVGKWPCCDKLLFLSLSQGEVEGGGMRLTPRNMELLRSVIRHRCSPSRGRVTFTDRWCTKKKRKRKTHCKQQDSAAFLKTERMWFPLVCISQMWQGDERHPGVLHPPRNHVAAWIHYINYVFFLFFF